MVKKQKQKNHINKEEYKHYLIDTVNILTQENESLREQLKTLEKDYNTIFNDWRVDRVSDPKECYRCTCGSVSECNCYHLGFKAFRTT